MKTDSSVKKLSLQGMIGETSDFFRLPLKDVQELQIDMKGVTYMNSIGVKSWLAWTVHIPLTCKVRLYECPYMIVSQGASVYKFLPTNFIVESFYAPFLCAACEHESSIHLIKDNHYGYANGATAEWFKVPTELTCEKCGEKKLEPDFFVDKIFKFLQPVK